MDATLSRRGRLILSLGAFLLLVSLGLPLHAEGAFPVLPDEAPSSLFDLTYGSAEAELLVKGSWALGLTATAGLVIDSSGSVSLSQDQPLLFTQTPDLYISFLLFKQFFAEIRMSSDSSESRYSLGYRGGEGAVLKEARAGNDGISFPVLPFLSLGAGSWRSFGLAADLEAGGFAGKAMLRYDQATRVEKLFVGGTEVTETVLNPTSFVRGRWFVVDLSSGPSTAANLELYIESSAGSLLCAQDGLRYRKMAVSEYSYSVTTGHISLASVASTKILAWYTGLTGSYSVNGRASLLLFDPDNTEGAATPAGYLAAPTLALGRYAVTGSEGSDAYVRDLSTGLVDSAYTVSIDPAGWAEVTYNGIVSPQDPAYRQPFVADMDWLYSTILSGDNMDKTYAPSASKAIVLRLYSQSSRITIDTDVVEGSVELTRNGVPDYSFTVDAASGSLSLGVAPGLDEEIRISYLRESADRSSGSLAAGLGGFVDLGEGRRAWTALGLRWSVPGTSYASSGQADPGKIVLTAGEEDTEGPLTHSLALAGQWSTSQASGRYRIDGMESTTTYHLSYRPLSGGGDFTALEIKESRLASQWPTLEAGLHSDGSAQKALVIEASAAGSLLLAKYIDAPPVSDLRVLSFMARTTGLSSSAKLTIELDQGGSASLDAELLVTIPASALGLEWRRFVLRYGYGESEVYVQAEEGGSLSSLGSAATASCDLGRSSASRLLVGLDSAALGDAVWVDEILLEEASGSAALLLKGELSYRDKDLRWGPGGLGRGLSLGSDLSAAWSDYSYLAGGSSLATAFGPVSLGARLRASLSPEGFVARGGHSLGLSSPGLPLKASEIFDSDPATGSFGRKDSLGLGLGKVLSLNLGQATSYAGASAGGTGLFSQAWTAKAELGGNILSASLDAKSSGYPGTWSGLVGDYGSNWYESLAYLLPVRESEAKLRSLDGLVLLSAGTAGEVLKVLLSASEQPLAASPRRDQTFFVKVQLPLSFGKDLLLAPYYKRTSTRTDLSTSGSILDFAQALGADLLGNSVFWASVPFAELFGDSSTSASAFRDWAGAEGLASYKPELGLVLARSYGSSLLDLVLPSALSLAWFRTYSLASSAQTTGSGLILGVKVQAVNVLGQAGSHPFLPAVESDEYHSSLQVELGMTEGNAVPSLSVVLQNLVTLYGGGSRDSLDLDNRLSWKRDSAGASWSESLDLSLSLRRERNWLFDLYLHVLEAATKLQASPAKGPEALGVGPPKASVTSLWLEGLGRASPLCRTVFSAVVDLSSKETDGSAAALSLSATESVAWKVVAKDLLTLACKASLVETRSADTGAFTVGPALELSATILF